MKTWEFGAAVGGVAQRVAVEWDEDEEFRKAEEKAFVRFCRGLELAGILKRGEKHKDGDYTRVWFRIDLPSPRQ